MKLLDVGSQVEFEAEILEVDEKDVQKIRTSRQFQFDWRAEKKKNHVLKIVEAGEEAPPILGLISLTDIPEEFRIQVNLIENSSDNKGRNKKVDRIAGCLLAFAAQIAFERGYAGFTSLVPKTELIELYVGKYGFQQYGQQLAIDGADAIELIQKYL
jgi:hypothetical protein